MRGGGGQLKDAFSHTTEDMQNVADVADIADMGSEKWEGSSFKESNCCFDQDLRELHSIFQQGMLHL